jgi:iron complex transport system substrate-binding protein
MLTNRMRAAFLATALTGAVLTLPAMAQTTVEHAQGELALEATPQTVIVTDWAAFDNLQALGVPVSGVPASATPPYLASFVPEDMPRVGSLQEPDVEGIVAAEPDLVIVAARSRRSYPTLAPVAPTIDMSVDNTDIINGVKTNLAKYGEIFGVEDKAAELSSTLDARIEEARAAAEGKGTGLVVVTNGGRLGIYGPRSRVAWLYDALDIPPVVENVDDRRDGGDAASFEYVLERNPDWLFVVDRDAGVGNEGSAEATLDNELIHETSFWQKGQIIYLDPAAAYVTMHGYTGLMRLLDQVIEGYEKAS